MEEKIDRHTLEAIEKGCCSLFLGAGASRGAGGPSTQELIEMITPDHIIERPVDLNRAAELFLDARNNPTVWRKIFKSLNRLTPTDEHLALPRYEWRAIITTNYDRLVEKAYEMAGPPFQDLKPIISESDLTTYDHNNPLTLPLVKLHGCITSPASIVMSWRDIYDAKHNRRLLFNYVESLYILGPVIHIGYSMGDIHILEMLYDLNKRLGKLRQTVYFISREPGELKRYADVWVSGSLRCEYLNYGFSGFIHDLKSNARQASGPSNIVRKLAPCTAKGFGGAASLKVKIEEVNGEWEAQITYNISNDEGYAGVIFETNGEPVDLSNYKELKFELWVENVRERQRPTVDALKLETANQTFPFYYDISQLREGEWNDCSVSMEEYRQNVELSKIERIVFADNGHRAKLNETYTMKLRRVTFI